MALNFYDSNSYYYLIIYNINKNYFYRILNNLLIFVVKLDKYQKLIILKWKKTSILFSFHN